MAKKKTTARRVPRSTTPRTFSDSAPSQPADVATAVQTAPAANGSTAARSGLQDLRRRAAARTEARVEAPLSVEYAYVPGDLKRLALLALAMLAVMVALGLILH